MRGQEVSVTNIKNAVLNSGFGFRRYKPKIFLIGFNKCGTTSFHKFFHAQGLKSWHFKLKDKYLAVEASRSTDVVSCRKTFAHGQVFSDFTYFTEETFLEPLDMYGLWRMAFPDAYFILNSRDVDSWLNSRMNHRGGTFFSRYMLFSEQTKDEVLIEWRNKFQSHTENVLSFFENDERFCHFMVGQDDIDKIVSFLAPDYSLSAGMFNHVNSTRSSG